MSPSPSKSNTSVRAGALKPGSGVRRPAIGVSSQRPSVKWIHDSMSYCASLTRTSLRPSRSRSTTFTWVILGHVFQSASAKSVTGCPVAYFVKKRWWLLSSSGSTSNSSGLLPT